MRRLSVAAFFLGASSLSALAASPTLASTRLFMPPAPFDASSDVEIPSQADVTGSIARPAIESATSFDPALAPISGIPDLGIASPFAELEPQPSVPADLGTSIQAWVQAAAPASHAGPAEPVRQRQAVREQIAAFYGSRRNAPLWIEGGRVSAAARAALSRIDRAGEDGLTLRSYPVPVLRDGSASQMAGADLALSEAVVAYAQQAGGSRIDPLQINRLITAKRTIADPSEILPLVAGAPDAGAALQRFNPQQQGYRDLRRNLAELRQAAPVAGIGMPQGPTLKPGMHDARVPLIRARFGLDARHADPQDDLLRDTRVATAVEDIQHPDGLPQSGTLTPGTIASLSGGDPRRLENEILANMEEWRWLPRELGDDHILVNVPDFSLDLVHDGVVRHHARVVVGKPDHPTPIFSDAMRFIIVNPYWNVPLSIIKKEMMPKLAQNPNYFTEHGYEVVQRNGMTYVRQPPGEDNALGRIKFMFPNEHSVYLHDTNARALFGKTKRAFSHGCVRVDQPFRLAEAVLGADRGWTEKRIQKMVGGGERTINLPEPLPIHIAYFTAFDDARGALQLRDDVYGYTQKVKSALGLRD